MRRLVGFLGVRGGAVMLLAVALAGEGVVVGVVDGLSVE